ncbi:unnamed protein product [Bursaphelenchus okinawaensis]|uniref:Uncharacterized protein n=1 Tax=Bursaphelenchus okinawaensis TaxID=465554 RepID=A0A811JT22_9BILA|nr:unnamed protein product [Bursaphelenchus okinawaensis]CAG9082003.1 unnamed protein product [Bursaphelenchus okinawaensis]
MTACNCLLLLFVIFYSTYGEPTTIEESQCPIGNKQYVNDHCYCFISSIDDDEIKTKVYLIKNQDACSDDFFSWWLFTSWPFFMVGIVLFVFGIQLWLKKRRCPREDREAPVTRCYTNRPPEYSAIYELPKYSDECPEGGVNVLHVDGFDQHNSPRNGCTRNNEKLPNNV